MRRVPSQFVVQLVRLSLIVQGRDTLRLPTLTEGRLQCGCLGLPSANDPVVYQVPGCTPPTIGQLHGWKCMLRVQLIEGVRADLHIPTDIPYSGNYAGFAAAFTDGNVVSKWISYVHVITSGYIVIVTMLFIS